jgi:hypothetical protein
MTQPTDEDVEQVIAFTGFTDRALIIAALKVGTVLEEASCRLAISDAEAVLTELLQRLGQEQQP